MNVWNEIRRMEDEREDERHRARSEHYGPAYSGWRENQEYRWRGHPDYKPGHDEFPFDEGWEADYDHNNPMSDLETRMRIHAAESAHWEGFHEEY